METVGRDGVTFPNGESYTFSERTMAWRDNRSGRFTTEAIVVGHDGYTCGRRCHRHVVCKDIAIDVIMGERA